MQNINPVISLSEHSRKKVLRKMSVYLQFSRPPDLEQHTQKKV